MTSTLWIALQTSSLGIRFERCVRPKSGTPNKVVKAVTPPLPMPSVDHSGVENMQQPSVADLLQHRERATRIGREAEVADDDIIREPAIGIAK
jgi:hypothetical protein